MLSRQLRDLIYASPTDPDEVYFTYQNNIQKYNCATKKTALIQALDFAPASLCIEGSFICAGGHDAQLFVKQNDQIIANTTTGGSINNSVHICKSATDTSHRLCVSNNDFTVKVYDLPSMEHRTNINGNIAINYCTTTRDGALLACVGDNNYVQLFDTRLDYKPVAKLKDYTDGGFGAAFNYESTQLAAASQDGSVVIFEMRKFAVLKRLYSQQKIPKGSARCVKYAPLPSVDLLAFAEHENMVHMVDTRTFEQAQVVKVSSTSADKHISGLAFSSNCKSIFIGLEDALLQYHVNLLEQRMFAQATLM